MMRTNPVNIYPHNTGKGTVLLLGLVHRIHTYNGKQQSRSIKPLFCRVATAGKGFRTDPAEPRSAIELNSENTTHCCAETVRVRVVFVYMDFAALPSSCGGGGKQIPF